jgi:hypothetical protein
MSQNKLFSKFTSDKKSKHENSSDLDVSAQSKNGLKKRFTVDSEPQ